MLVLTSSFVLHCVKREYKKNTIKQKTKNFLIETDFWEFLVKKRNTFFNGSIKTFWCIYTGSIGIFRELCENRLSSFLSSAAHIHTGLRFVKQYFLSSGVPKSDISTKNSNSIFFTITILSLYYSGLYVRWDNKSLFLH